MSRLVPKAKFFIANGIAERVEIDAESIIMQTHDGSEYELYFRRSDDIASLSVERGSMIIHPVAANVVRLENKR